MDRPSMKYSVYVLAVLTITFLLNQLDRFMLAIVNSSVAKDLHYGMKGCMENTTLDVQGQPCDLKQNDTKEACLTVKDQNGTSLCVWDYNGHGFEYQLLAGPVFIVVYTFCGIPLGFAADAYNRKNLLIIVLLVWSGATVLMGFVNQYWHLVVLRFLQGAGQAGCTPLASSLIADYFEDQYRGTALSIYNWGIYIGYSMSFAIGNFVTQANIMDMGWRWAFIVSGLPGFLIAGVMLFSLKEPKRRLRTDQKDTGDMASLLSHTEVPVSCCTKLARVLKPFGRPTLILLCIAGSLRNAGGYVWAYNVQGYFEAIGQNQKQIGSYMSWIPIVGGSLGVVVGGGISDLLLKRSGPLGRMSLLIVSQIVAAPFVAGALFLKPPAAYFSLLPGYVIGEMWIGVTLAVGLELVPTPLRASAVGVYLFIISNVAGNMTLLVPPLTRVFQEQVGLPYTNSLRAALYILYPGLYLAGALFYFFTMLVLRRDLRRYLVNEYSALRESQIREELDQDESDTQEGMEGMKDK